MFLALVQQQRLKNKQKKDLEDIVFLHRPRYLPQISDNGCASLLSHPSEILRNLMDWFDTYLHDISCHWVGRDVEVPISERFEDTETFTATSADQKPVFGFYEAEDPGVAFHRRLFARHGRRLFAEQVETFCFDVGYQAGMRPRHVRNGPMGRRSRPNSRTFERRRDLNDESLADPQFDFGRIRHHFDNVAISRLVAGLNIATI